MAKRAPLLFLLLSLALLSSLAHAQSEPPTDDEVNRVAKKLYCPVCENVPLDVCPTQACTQWRATIREKLTQGWSEQQILDYFVAQYGERVLARPSTRGLNILVWILPPAAFAAGAFVLWRFLRAAQRTPPAPASATSTPPSDEFLARLERDLEQRR
jgi:cytochrome c-type biogenesis protein CcmH